MRRAGELAAVYGTALVSAGLAIYWPALSGGFVFDDVQLTAPGVLHGMLDPRVAVRAPRPLLMLSYGLNYWWAGMSPFGFHLVNILIHCCNAVLLWRILAVLAARSVVPGWGIVVYGTPILFLSSPVLTETVAYVSSRSELLATAFYLLALLVFVSRWRERRDWLAAAVIVVLYVCAVSSKQSAVTLPGALVLVEWLLLSRRIRWALVGGMVVGGVVVGASLLKAPTAGFFLENVPWTDYLSTQLRVWFLYLRLLILPVGLNVDHDVAASHNLTDHQAWLALLGLAVLVRAALWARQRVPLVSFGVLFFVVTLAPSSSFFPLADFAAEHRLYLPSIGFYVAITGGLAAVWRWSSYVVPWVAIAAVCSAYAAGTWQRSRVWADGLALWEDAARKSPLKYRPHNHVGVELLRRHRYEEAAEAFAGAEALVGLGSPHHAHIVNNLGLSHANRGLHAKAVEYYERALRIADLPTFRANLAISQVRMGAEAEGWLNFERALQMSGGAVSVRMARADEYMRVGRLEEAVAEYELILSVYPDFESARQQLAVAGLKARDCGQD